MLILVMASRYNEQYRGLPAEIRLEIWKHLVPRSVEFYHPKEASLDPTISFRTDDEFDYHLLLLNHEVKDECLPLYQAIDFSYSDHTLEFYTTGFINSVQRRLAMGSPMCHVTLRGTDICCDHIQALLQDTTPTAGRTLKTLRVNYFENFATDEEVESLSHSLRYLDSIEDHADIIVSIGVSPCIADVVVITLECITNAAKQYFIRRLNERLTSVSSRSDNTKQNHLVNVEWGDRPLSYWNEPSAEELDLMGSGTIEFGELSRNRLC